MDPLDYLRLLRRRWWIVAVVLGLSLGGALLTLPDRSGPGHVPAATSYSATHTLLQSPGVTNPVNLELVRLFTTTGEIPGKAAVRLGQAASQGALLASQVQVVADGKVSALRITVNDRDGARAAAIANAFATEVKEFLRSSAARDRASEAAALQTSLNVLTGKTIAIQKKIARGPIDAPLLEAQREVYAARYESVFARLQTLQDQGPTTSSLQTLAVAVPIPVIGTGSPVPNSPRGRLGLAVVLGLLLGAALMLVVDRLDTRLRRREQVEDAFRLPVVAEIPTLDRNQRKGFAIATLSAPQSAVAESYRVLRSSLLLVPSRPVPIGDVPEPLITGAGDWQPPRVVLVTSAAPNDGKTNTAVNLATTLAESGWSVIVLDADFRKPTANRFLKVPHSAGLSDLLAGNVPGGIRDVLRETAVPGVHLVTSGSSLRHPASLLRRMDEIVRQARELADFVIIDTAPLLAANDATDIIPHADTVLLIARAGRTTRPQAERVSELLGRLGPPVLGVVLQASKQAHGVGSYYNGYSQPDRDVKDAPATADLATVRTDPTVPPEAVPATVDTKHIAGNPAPPPSKITAPAVPPPPTSAIRAPDAPPPPPVAPPLPPAVAAAQVVVGAAPASREEPGPASAQNGFPAPLRSSEVGEFDLPELRARHQERVEPTVIQPGAVVEESP